MEWESTLARSDFKVRRETGFLTIIGLSHAEYMARSAARGVTDYDKPTGEHSIANDPRFGVIPTHVLDLDGHAFEDDCSVFEIQAPLGESACALRRVEGDAHQLL